MAMSRPVKIAICSVLLLIIVIIIGVAIHHHNSANSFDVKLSFEPKPESDASLIWVNRTKERDESQWGNRLENILQGN